MEWAGPDALQVSRVQDDLMKVKGKRVTGYQLTNIRGPGGVLVNRHDGLVRTGRWNDAGYLLYNRKESNARIMVH